MPVTDRIRSKMLRPTGRRWRSWIVLGGIAVWTLALLLPSDAQAEPKSEAQAKAKAELTEARKKMKRAERLVRTGQVEAGMKWMLELVTSFPEDARFLQQYTTQLRRHDRLPEAIALYQKRTDRDDAEPFLMQELEGMYRESNRLGDALDICLVYEGRTAQRGHWVIREIEAILGTRELGIDAVRKIEETLQNRSGNSRLYRVRLSALYFAGDTELALIEAQKLDQKRKAEGVELFAYAKMVEERGSLEDAVLALELLASGKPPEPLLQNSLLRRARLLRKLRRLDDTLLAYDEFLLAYPGNNATLIVLRSRAEILDKEQGRTQLALVAYEKVLAAVTPIRKAADIKIANETQLAMANCYLLLGNPERAGVLYQQMADEATDPAVRVEALYEVAEMLYFQGMPDDAETRYYEIIDNFPTSTWVNDALDRILLIGENNDMDGIPLAALAQAEFQWRMGSVQKGISLLRDAQESFPESEASDNLMFGEIELRLAVGEIKVAAVRADSLAARYPESVLAPRALKKIADYYADTTGGKPAAKEIYTDILLRFPDALEVPEVRAELQNLQGRRSDSSELWRPETKGWG